MSDTNDNNKNSISITDDVADDNLQIVKTDNILDDSTIADIGNKYDNIYKYGIQNVGVQGGDLYTKLSLVYNNIGPDELTVNVLVGGSNLQVNIPYVLENGRYNYYFPATPLLVNEKTGYKISLDFDDTKSFNIKGYFSARLYNGTETLSASNIFLLSDSTNVSNILTTNEDKSIFIDIDNRVYHTVRYLVDGIVYYEERLPEGSGLVRPNIPVKDGYRFNHWDLNGTEFNFENYTLSGSLNIDAVFDKVWQVSFIIDNSLFKMIEVVDGGSVERQEDPESTEDKIFIGWYVDDRKFDFENNIISSNINIDARFSKKVTIALDVNGGFNCPSEIEIVDNTIVELPEPYYNDGTFDYWQGDVGKYKSGDIISGETRLTAIYKNFRDYALLQFTYDAGGYSVVRVDEPPELYDSVEEVGCHYTGYQSDGQFLEVAGDVYRYFGKWLGNDFIPTDLFQNLYIYKDEGLKKCYIYSPAKYIFVCDATDGYRIFKVNSSYVSWYQWYALKMQSGRIRSSHGTSNHTQILEHQLFNRTTDIDIYNMIIGSSVEFNSALMETIDLSRCEFIKDSIQKYSFKGTSNLKNIVWPDYVNGCKLKTLEQMFADSGVEYIDLSMFELEQPKYLGYKNYSDIRYFKIFFHAFYNCKNLVDIKFPSVTWDVLEFCKRGYADYKNNFYNSGIGEEYTILYENCIGMYYMCNNLNIEKYIPIYENMTWVPSDIESIKSNNKTYIGGTPIYQNLITQTIVVNKVPRLYNGKITLSSFKVNVPAFIDVPIKKLYDQSYASDGRFSVIQNFYDYGYFIDTYPGHEELYYICNGVQHNINDIVNIRGPLTVEFVYGAFTEIDLSRISNVSGVKNIFMTHDRSLLPDNAIDLSVARDKSCLYSIITSNGYPEIYIYVERDKAYCISDQSNKLSNVYSSNIDILDLHLLDFENVSNFNNFIAKSDTVNKIILPDDMKLNHVVEEKVTNTEWKSNVFGQSKYVKILDGPDDLGYVGGYFTKEPIILTFYDSDVKVEMMPGRRLLDFINKEQIPTLQNLSNIEHFVGWSNIENSRTGIAINEDYHIFTNCILYPVYSRMCVSKSGQDIRSEVLKKYDISTFTKFGKGSSAFSDECLDISLDDNRSIWLYADGTSLFWNSVSGKFIANNDMSYLFSNYSSINYIDLTDFDFSYMPMSNSRQMFYQCSVLSNINYGDFDYAELSDESTLLFSSLTSDNPTFCMFYNCPANKPDKWTIGRYNTSGTYVLNRFVDVNIYRTQLGMPQLIYKVHYGYTLGETEFSNGIDDPTGVGIFKWYTLNNVAIDTGYVFTDTVTLNSVFSFPGYTNGPKVNSAMNYSAVAFRHSQTAPTVSATDISLDLDKSVLTWYDSKSKVQYWWSESGELKILNTAASMFAHKSNLVLVYLTDIDFNTVTSYSSMFSECNKLQRVYNGDMLVGDKATTFAYMFNNCNSLTDIDLSQLNTSSALDMSYMFYRCTNLQVLDLSRLVTDNVINYQYMFYGCRLLTPILPTVINIPDSFILNVDSTVNKTFNMCNGCKFKPACSKEGRFNSNGTFVYGLNSIISFNVCKPTNMQSQLIAPANKSVMMGYSMNECSIELPMLVGVEGYEFVGWSTVAMDRNTKVDLDTPIGSNITLYALWSKPGYILGGSQLSVKIPHAKTARYFDPLYYDLDNSLITNTIDISECQDGSVVLYVVPSEERVYYYSFVGFIKCPADMSQVFYNKSYYYVADIREFDTSDTITMNGMFRGCTSMTSIQLVNIDLSNVINMSYFAYGCSKLMYLEFHCIPSKALKYAQYMCYNCKYLMHADFTNLDTTNVLDFQYMFYYCNRLTDVKYGSLFVPNSGNSFGRMFYYAANMPKPPVENGWTGTWDRYGTYSK